MKPACHLVCSCPLAVSSFSAFVPRCPLCSWCWVCSIEKGVAMSQKMPRQPRNTLRKPWRRSSLWPRTTKMHRYSACGAFVVGPSVVVIVRFFRKHFLNVCCTVVHVPALPCSLCSFSLFQWLTFGVQSSLPPPCVHCRLFLIGTIPAGHLPYIWSGRGEGFTEVRVLSSRSPSSRLLYPLLSVKLARVCAFCVASAFVFSIASRYEAKYRAALYAFCNVGPCSITSPPQTKATRQP